jgi:hypothetical protein
MDWSLSSPRTAMIATEGTTMSTSTASRHGSSNTRIPGRPEEAFLAATGMDWGPLPLSLAEGPNALP